MLYSENDADALDFDVAKIVTSHKLSFVRHGGKTRYNHTQRYLPGSGQHGYRMGRYHGYGRRNAADDAESADTHERRPPRRERRYGDWGSEEATRFVC